MNTENKLKVDAFLEELKANKTVLLVANHFKKSIEEVYKLIQKYIIILYYRNGNIKQIKIDFLETQSEIKIFQNSKF
jgi:hypothetical protein